jgi:protease-4
LIREIGTSGAYWVASASDFIIADEMSLTGSIGVNGGYLEFAGLMKDYGVSYQEMKAGLHKDIGNPYEHLGHEEREILQSKLDLIHEKFIQSVANNRNMSYVEIADVAEGLFYLGVEAKDIGLIDAFGSFDDAKEKTEDITGIELEEKRYEVEKGMFSIFDMLSVKGSYNVGRGIGDSLTDVDLSSGLVPMA